MNSRIAYLHQSLTIFTPPVTSFLAQLEASQLDTRISSANSPLNWTIGHLINSRNGAAGLLGAAQDLPGWPELFGRGSVPGPAAGGPSLTEFRDAWQTVSDSLLNALANVTDEVLDADSPRTPPAGLKTTGQFLALLTVHDTYHIGQLGHFSKELFGKAILGR